MLIERQLQEAMSVAVDTNRRIITLGEENKIKADEGIKRTKEELERQKQEHIKALIEERERQQQLIREAEIAAKQAAQAAI